MQEEKILVRTNNVRKITKFKRSIKAISPVIATLLMIAIAVVASLVVYAWVSGYMGFQTNKAGKAIQIQSTAVDGNGLHVYVQNVGQGVDQIGAVYVDNQKVADFTTDTSKQIGDGNTVELLINDKTYDSNTRYDIKVTTTDGTFITTTGKPGTGGSTNPGTTQYDIVVTQGSNGVIAPGTSSYNAGSTPSFTITPNTGYHIASITTSAGAQTVTTPAGQTYTFPALGGAATLTATFAVNTVQYQVTVTQGSNGVIAPGTSSYNAGSTPSFTITPNTGYHIASITTSAGAQTVTTPAGQTYTFPALGGAATLTATYVANTPQTLTLRPSGTGNAAELSRFGSGLSQNYQAVDETAADGSTTYVYRDSSSGSFYTDTYATQDSSVSTGTINSVKVYVVCNYDSGSATPHARTVLRVAGTDYYGTDTTAITSTWTTISTTYNTNPAGGNWNWAAINALECGVELYRTSGGGTIRCTQVYIEVNYTPA
jgi:flagellin-like protein